MRKLCPFCLACCIVSVYILLLGCLTGLIWIAVDPGGLRPKLRVVLPEYEAATNILAPFGPGFERELLAHFQKDFDCTFQYLTVTDSPAALEMLRTGKADMAVGFSGSVCEAADIFSGPDYHRASVVTVNLPPLADTLPLAPGKQEALREYIPGLYALDARSWTLWAAFTPALSRKDSGNALVLPTESRLLSYRWFWRKDLGEAAHALARFWKQRTLSGDRLLARLEERYYSYLPSDPDRYEVLDFLSILRHRLPRYRDMIADAVRDTKLDPLLFVAVVIQESRLDERTVSVTGVRGIMQLTQETARHLGVNRLNPAEALRGGARYLEQLWSSLDAQELDPWDRWFFTLAAFNQGPHRLRGARELSRRMGGSGRTWQEIKHVFPLLANPRYASLVNQRTCRGREAVRYVEQVRWLYHLLRSLVALDRPEAQHLAPLLRVSLWSS